MRAAIIRTVVTIILGTTVCGRSLYGQETNAVEVSYPAGVLCAWSTNGSQRLFLPLKQTDVHLEMVSGILTATVSQRFVNDTSFALEAMYLFPLPPDAAITDMQMRVGDRIITSVVQEKAAAKKTYEVAKAAGKKTALLEASRPNVFETSLANLMPGETVDIMLSFSQVAALHRGGYDVTFPMVVGERYYPAPKSLAQGECRDTNAFTRAVVLDSQHVNPPVLHPAADPVHRLSLVLDVYGVPVQRVTSNTHRIDVTRISGTPLGRRVKLADDVTVPNSDFNVYIEVKESAMLASSFMAAEHGGMLHGLLTVFPPAQERSLEATAPARDVVFLIDTSGSMGGESIGQAKSGLKRCLRMLRPEDRFTIVRFSSDFSSFAPELRPATEERLQAGIDYVESLVADGGTEMQKALSYVLELLAGSNQMPMVVFLTDGCVGNEDSLMALLAEKLHHGRLFSFGIGSAPNALLLNKVAEIGRGESRFIRSHEDVGRVMSDFFETLAAPVLTDVSVEWLDELGAVMHGQDCYPNPCPDIFVGRPLQIVGRFPEKVSGAVIHGTVNGVPKAFREVFAPCEKMHASVARLFGSERVNELMFRMLRPETPAEKIDLRRQALMTALSYQLVTKMTSRVAVEEIVSRSPDGVLQAMRVPVAPAKGWNMFNATATQDTLLLLMGCGCLATAMALLWCHHHRCGTRKGSCV